LPREGNKGGKEEKRFRARSQKPEEGIQSPESLYEKHWLRKKDLAPASYRLGETVGKGRVPQVGTRTKRKISARERSQKRADLTARF